jgi:hypothetical protein
MKALIASIAALGMVASPALASTKTSTITTKTPAAKVTTTKTAAHAKVTHKRLANAPLKKGTKSASANKKAPTKKPA